MNREHLTTAALREEGDRRGRGQPARRRPNRITPRMGTRTMRAP